MLVNFFHELKSAGLPVTLREYLTLMEAMDRDLAGRRVDAWRRVAPLKAGKTSTGADAEQAFYASFK
jgi:uncharacterized protein with von Willebrand factor type A (vWA) domain